MGLGFTEADLEQLKTALASGALEVQIGDRRVKYQSIKDLLAVINMVQAELEGVDTDTAPSMIQATFSKGAK